MSEAKESPALVEIKAFLACETPALWVEEALRQQSVLLIDHANCEKKAAGTAMSLMYKYINHSDLLNKMSKLAREELRHFEQVLEIMSARNIAYVHVSASRYAAELRKLIRPQEPWKLVDTLIIGAFIEARSCERFAALAPHLDAELAKFYTSLLKSESRHYRDYLSLAKKVAGVDISDRIALVAEAEKRLIESPDDEFRFHSGLPV
ncbi:MAG: tRNA isopentenyl-2-thiomethyl-A-37 hydroxylase MiaE [Porticoccaceae bacterium]|nr:tRNA isopentenyl-2-thiomethyl-A-37 hydroxylase MiaE [Porticoccaceae bacterium]